MVYEGSTNWLHAIPIVEPNIINSIQDNTGFSPVYIGYRTLNKMPIDMLDWV